jgi:hypothetical protein
VKKILCLLCTLALSAVALSQPKKGPDTPAAKAASPYFSDKFETLDPDRWSVALPPKHPDIRYAPGTDTADGLRLLNRPHVTTRDGFPDGAEFSFEWKWVWDEDRTATYEDHFQVVIRGNGKYKEGWSHEPTEGLRFKIHPVTGEIALDLLKDGKAKRLATKTYEVNVNGAVAIPDEKWFEIVIRDDGKRVQFIWDREIDPKTKVLIDVPYDLKDVSGNRLTLTNREATANVPKVSCIKNFSAKPLKKK